MTQNLPDNLYDHVRIEDHLLQASLPGTQRMLRFFRFGEPSAGVKVYLQAALHGGEHPGMLVLHQLAGLLQNAAAAGELVGEVIIAPVANPIGLSQQVQGEILGRFHLSSGQNFNRGFAQIAPELIDAIKDRLGHDAGQNTQIFRQAAGAIIGQRRPRDELESLHNHQLKMALQADYVLDLHCDGESLLHIYSGEAGGDEFDQLYRQMGASALLVGSDRKSHCFDDTINSLWDHIEAHFTDFSFARRSRAATVELRGRADVDISYAQKDADNIFRTLQRWGVIRGDAGVLPPALHDPSPLQAMYHARAHYPGIVIYKKKLGDYCEKGDEIALTVDPNDPFSAPVERFTAPAAGLFFSKNISKLVSPNMVVFKLTGHEIIKQASKGGLLEE